MTRVTAAGAALTFLASVLLPLFAPAGVVTSPRREVVKVTAGADMAQPGGTKDGPTRAPYAAAPATTRRAFPPPATRAYRRPPLAEETRWRSTSTAHAPRSVARVSGSSGNATTTAAAHRSSSVDPGLRAAEALPQPWRSIVHCESIADGSWRVSSTSRARGFFQFLRSTWRSLGLAGDPAGASFEEQYAAARRLRARDGLRAWSCARLLGIA